MAYCASVVSAVSLTFATHPAKENDLVGVRHLLARASRTFISFGDEDLRGYVSSRNGSLAWLAERRGRLRGFLAVSTARPFWPEVRGLVLSEMDGSLVRRLVEAAREALFDAGSSEGLICLASVPWLETALGRAGFCLIDHVVNYRCTVAECGLPLSGESHALRRASGNDLTALLELDRSAFDHLWQLGSTHMMIYLLTVGHFMVVERAGEIIGYAAATVSGREGQVVRLAVRPDAQGEGWGRRLLTDALSYCAGKRARVVMLNTQASNQVSQHLYESVGFRPFGRAVPVLTYRWT